MDCDIRLKIVSFIFLPSYLDDLAKLQYRSNTRHGLSMEIVLVTTIMVQDSVLSSSLFSTSLTRKHPAVI